jgi:hypothetical protein
LHLTKVKLQTHLNINCSEETAWIRPSKLNFCKETLNKGHQQEDETCLGLETRAMDIRPVEICPLVCESKFEMWDIAVPLLDAEQVNRWCPHGGR